MTAYHLTYAICQRAVAIWLTSIQLSNMTDVTDSRLGPGEGLGWSGFHSVLPFWGDGPDRGINATVSVKIGDNLLTFRNKFGGNVFYPSSSFWTVPPPWQYLLRQPWRDPDNGLCSWSRLLSQKPIPSSEHRFVVGTCLVCRRCRGVSSAYELIRGAESALQLHLKSFYQFFFRHER